MPSKCLPFFQIKLPYFLMFFFQPQNSNWFAEMSFVAQITWIFQTIGAKRTSEYKEKDCIARWPDPGMQQ